MLSIKNGRNKTQQKGTRNFFEKHTRQAILNFVRINCNSKAKYISRQFELRSNLSAGHALPDTTFLYLHSLIGGPSRLIVSNIQTTVDIRTMHLHRQMVGWCLTSKYMAITGTKGQGWRAIPSQYRKASDILTSTTACYWLVCHVTSRCYENKVSLS